ncbi:hypothetical protein H4Q26_015499 [Puccinia striiformis f. sp. tritici PST-130]|uniref:Secreted protein n=1 Tax=Puccinia striiformis f. sp. tritici PST-78 TaxID=1165861 RepID=A0A0L0UY52_9BASI|nr:hypothetical protein H4Q26_015499 [Puccinia striiformis f. sp. tritici PST-130]KNE91957.1 hypothetical protein PSTG_14628 [Puccinia striiformis f. sp. tritici PST-78]
MNMLQRAYITFALLVISITLHPGQVRAKDIVTKECTYHFNRVGAVKGRAYNNIYYYKCHASDFSAWRDSVHAAQYYRRDDYASVQDFDGSWWDCPYNIPEAHNKQYLRHIHPARVSMEIHSHVQLLRCVGSGKSAVSGSMAGRY